jgi:Amt family ammonium transporter
MFRNTRFVRRVVALAIATLVLTLVSVSVHAQEDTAAAVTIDAITDLQVQIDTSWVLITAMLVFFMQTGFALLEAGFIQQRGVVNALLENFMDAGLTAIVFWAVGYGLAFGTSAGGGLVGTSNFFLSDAISYSNGSIIYGQSGLSILSLWFFQFAFAATASTIATGGMAERTDFIGDIIYSALVGAIIYPIVVHWVWGGGWLAGRGFHDFAGSTVVHTVGGVVALTGAIMLGPRANRKFGSPPKPHNLALATLGTMILWFGWYGFNPGSTLGMGSGNSNLAALVAVNTTLAAGAGTLSAMFYMYSRTGKWDLGLSLNGSLAGLVGITAGCAFVAPWAAIVIGLCTGVLVCVVVDVIENLKIDDPVGAFAVHGACGIFGTLAIGILGQPELTGDAGGLLLGGGLDSFITQFIGSAATVVWVGGASVVMFSALKAMGRLRVNPKADAIGIDIYEHGASLWPDVLPFEDEGEMAGTAATAPATGD